MLETLVAAAIVTVAVVSMAGVVAATARTNGSASTLSFASIAAAQKMEQLRALTWGYDGAGLPVSDSSSDLTVEPEQPFGGPGLSASPPTALQADTAGFCDYLDQRGQPMSGAAGAQYVRRWSIQALPSAGTDTLVIQVLVRRASRAARAPLAARDEGEARLVTLKTRKRP